ncbi:MAG: hypothetical protein Q8R30_02135 [bacterium]|nr:hypothetical protein [bacterium]MDZ4260390.1 hypothetical protein [Candidatus Sungbacteria bacterium]
MDRRDIIPLPIEYEQRIIDDKGNMLDVAANLKRLFVRTLAGYDKESPDTVQVDTISIPSQDSLRLIMMIACVAKYSGGLDEKTSELLGAIEIVARHAIARQCRELPSGTSE